LDKKRSQILNAEAALIKIKKEAHHKIDSDLKVNQVVNMYLETFL